MRLFRQLLCSRSSNKPTVSMQNIPIHFSRYRSSSSSSSSLLFNPLAIINVLSKHVQARRFEKIHSTFQTRLRDLTIVFENIREPLNIAACLRTADAYGIQHIHIINRYGESDNVVAAAATNDATNPRGGDNKAKKHTSPHHHHLHAATSVDSGAAKWLSIHYHESLEACIESLRKEKYALYVGDLSAGAFDIATATYKSLELPTHIPTTTSTTTNTTTTRPRIALVFGNEVRGASRLAADAADIRFFIPQAGFVQSLNISVACALAIHAFAHRTPDYAERLLHAHNARMIRGVGQTLTFDGKDAGGLMNPVTADDLLQQQQKQQQQQQHQQQQVKGEQGQPPPLNTTKGSILPSTSFNSLVCEGLPEEEINVLLARWLMTDVRSSHAILDRAGIRPADY